jgi:LuxR family maltose regulon positive regulatory protein
MISVAALRHLARLREREGRLHDAKAIFEQALALATDRQGRALPAAADVLIGLGDLWREWNDLQAAERYLQEGIELAGQWRKLGAIPGYLSLARIRQALGDVDGAQSAMQEAQELAAASDATQIDDLIVELLQAHLWIAQGELARVQRWTEERALDRETGSPEATALRDFVDSHFRKYEHIARARLALAQDRPDEALALLQPLLPRLEQQGRIGLVIEIQMLTALALQIKGDLAQAVATLERALSLAEPGGYVRTFLDEGEPMARLLRQAAARRARPQYAGRLLAAVEEQVAHAALETGQAALSPAGPPPLPLVDPLTKRELEVLRLLARGLSNPETANELFIATSTVRSHVKSIYSKLDVHKRWDAVERARELGLL